MKAIQQSISIAVIALVAAAGAQATSYNAVPMVDVHPGQQAQYQEDLAQCQGLVNSNQGNNKQAQGRRGMKAGAAVGAMGGLAAGRVDGNAGKGMARGAAWGAAAGGVSGRIAGDMADGVDSGYAVRRCLDGRGYEVLDYSREDRHDDA